MKQSTQDRLLEDAVKAASAWQTDAKAFETMAIINERERNAAYRSFPILFLAGMLTATLGILLAASAFNLN